MANLLEEAGVDFRFQNPAGWTDLQNATVDNGTGIGSDDDWFLTIYNLKSTLGPIDTLGRARSVATFDLTAGVTYTLSARIRKEGAAPERNIRIEILDSLSNILHTWTILASELTYQVFTQVVDSGFTPGADETGCTVRVRVLNRYTNGADLYYVDTVTLDYEATEELALRSTIKTFMGSLKTLIEGLDPNIGPVFETSKAWKSTGELTADGAAFAIASDGLFDTGRTGTLVVRFWFMDMQIFSQPLSNGSCEYRNVVRLTGFFQREADDTQEEALQIAVTEILDKLNEGAVEMTTLNTGEGYCGYLTERPSVTVHPQPADIGDGSIYGHSAQIQITFFEEVSF